MRWPLLVPLALLLTAALPPAPATAGPAAEPYCVPDLPDACGLLAAPTGEPKGLVVVAHGYGHKASSHAGHLAALAEMGFVAVAMDYRGEGFPLRAGADDTIAATADLRARFGPLPTTLYSVSMGTAVAGIVLAELPVFDWWVSNEGLSMLGETWAEASLLAPANAFAARAKADIEAECGAPVPGAACLAERSAALRAPEFRHLKGVLLAHGLNDGIVPYNQGREMAAALRAQGIPADFYTVVRGEPGGEGTTITSYTPLGQVDGLAGHGTESNDAHALTALSFGLLHRLLEGDAAVVPANRELVVDRDAPALP